MSRVEVFATGIKNPYFGGVGQGIKVTSELLKSSDQEHMAAISPLTLENQAIKGLRREWSSDQAHFLPIKTWSRSQMLQQVTYKWPPLVKHGCANLGNHIKELTMDSRNYSWVCTNSNRKPDKIKFGNLVDFLDVHVHECPVEPYLLPVCEKWFFYFDYITCLLDTLQSHHVVPMYVLSAYERFLYQYQEPHQESINMGV